MKCKDYIYSLNIKWSKDKLKNMFPNCVIISDIRQNIILNWIDMRQNIIYDNNDIVAIIDKIDNEKIDNYHLIILNNIGLEGDDLKNHIIFIKAKLYKTNSYDIKKYNKDNPIKYSKKAPISKMNISLECKYLMKRSSRIIRNNYKKHSMQYYRIKYY